MKNPRIFFVHVSAPADAVARLAAHEAFPDAGVREAATVDEVRRETMPGDLTLLVLGAPSSRSEIEAAHAAEADGRPRWALVVQGGEAARAGTAVSPEDWTPRFLVAAFHGAIWHHELLLENCRLRGDLKTVARRFSHDLYTPVGCINTSSCVLKILPAGDRQTLVSVIQNIEESSAEITQLIERVSFVLRASAEPAAPVEMEMGPVVAEALKQFGADFPDGVDGMEVPSSWPKVRGVAKWLQVIWWNLLHNARKHGGPGTRIRLAWRTDRQGYWFGVFDDGAGVVVAARADLFHPFEQLHLRHLPGLGLSIVRRLVDAQGGQSGYEPVPAGGSLFYFILPSPAG